ncbi:T9SS type A sorting domain-containing protein, partial [Chryseobacterium arthrosphaerae]
EVRDLTGNLVYHKQLRNEKQVEVNLSSRKEGVYIVNVITDKNETFSEKIIKK